jgi:hypothetical protein
MCVMTIIIMFPANPSPGVGGMNYTVVVQGVFCNSYPSSFLLSFFFPLPGGVLTLASLYYFMPKYGGIHWFKGPVITADREPEEASNSEDVDVLREKEEVEVTSARSHS